MKKVGYLPMLPGDSTDFYRCSGVLPYIKSTQIDFKPITDIISLDWHNLTGLDILIVQRPFNDYGLRVVDMAKAMNIKVILDYDDDLFNIPVFNSSYSLYKKNEETIKQCISLSDEVWVSTLGVKRFVELSGLHNNVHIIPNAHNDFMFPVELKKSFNRDTKLAVYRGGASHNEDVYSVQESIVKKINANPDWEFRFIGSRFPAIEVQTSTNHTYTDPLPIINYFNYLYESNPNVMFFPLITNKFNQAKSNISWLEATYAGAAFYGNTALKEFKRTDMIISIDHFFETQDVDVLEFYNNSAWDYIEKNLLLSKINKLREERLLW